MSEPAKGRKIRRSTPPLVLAIGFVATAFFVIPLIGLLSRTPWSRLGTVLTSEVVLEALGVSIVSSVLAALLSLIFGAPLAWILARREFPGRSIVRAVVTLPMVLPPVVGGAALLFAFGRRGFAGPTLETAGLTLPFSLWGVVVANTFVAMPFLIVTVEGALRSLDDRHEVAAASLGASELTILRRVTFPLIAPALRAGVILAWARALGEFGATVTFAGNLPGRTQTLPLAVFVALESDRDAAIAISLLLVIISVLVLVTFRGRWWSRT